MPENINRDPACRDGQIDRNVEGGRLVEVVEHTNARRPTPDLNKRKACFEMCCFFRDSGAVTGLMLKSACLCAEGHCDHRRGNKVVSNKRA